MSTLTTHNCTSCSGNCIGNHYSVIVDTIGEWSGSNCECPHDIYESSIKFVDMLFNKITVVSIDNVKSNPFIEHITSQKHICLKCSMMILKRSCFFKNWEQGITYGLFEGMISNNSKLYKYEQQLTLMQYLSSRDLIGIFLSIVSHPQIMYIFYRKKTLFHRFCKILYGACSNWFELNQINMKQLRKTVKCIVNMNLKGNRSDVEKRVWNIIKSVNVDIVMKKFEVIKVELGPILHHQFNILLFRLKSPKIFKWCMTSEFFCCIIDRFNEHMNMHVHKEKDHVCLQIRAGNNFMSFNKNPFPFICMNAVLLLNWYRNNQTLIHYLKNINDKQIVEYILKAMNSYTDEQIQHHFAANFTIFRLHKALSKMTMRCSNLLCNVRYWDRMYSEPFEIKGFKFISKWKLCKRCKIHYYCSRKCQKIDWNLGNHKRVCCAPVYHW
eukprot:103187_1